MFAYVAYIHRINSKIAYVCIYADSGARIGLRRLIVQLIVPKIVVEIRLISTINRSN